MSLETDVYYLIECEACKHRTKYIMRAKNVNPMPDSDIKWIANNKLGTYINEVCGDCGLFSRHKVIGYRWEELEDKD